MKLLADFARAEDGGAWLYTKACLRRSLTRQNDCFVNEKIAAAKYITILLFLERELSQSFNLYFSNIF